jgi:hypothetical protein
MKKYALLSFLVALILVATMLPTGLLSASPGNLVENGDFSDGLTNWETGGDVAVCGNVMLGPEHYSYVYQYYIVTSNKNLIFSCDAMRSNDSGSFTMGFDLRKDGAPIPAPDWAEKFFTPTVGKWVKLSCSISDIWKSDHGSEIPDFDEIGIWVQTYDGCVVYIDNISLEAPKAPSSTQQEEEPQVWVRDHEMECFKVWVNEDNNFEFVFWWEYKDNNHVQIFNMDGILVWETDFEKGEPHFIAELPDGMYTVKTFHEAGHILQEFVIGKP